MQLERGGLQAGPEAGDAGADAPAPPPEGTSQSARAADTTRASTPPTPPPSVPSPPPSAPRPQRSPARRPSPNTATTVPPAPAAWRGAAPRAAIRANSKVGRNSEGKLEAGSSVSSTETKPSGWGGGRQATAAPPARPLGGPPAGT